MKRSFGSVSPVWLGLLLSLSCGRGAVSPSSQVALPTPNPPKEDDVIATVNGVAITEGDIQRQAQAQKVSPKEALDALVRAEVLAQEAEKRGLVADSAVQLAGRQEMVRGYLKGVFEKEATPEKVVPALLMKQAYDKRIIRFVHPELREVDHLLVVTKTEDPKLRALAEEMHTKALATKTREEFVGIADLYKTKATELSASTKSEKVTTAREGWTVEPFAKAAFALTQEGQISPVVFSEYGYHVIRHKVTIPAENISYDQAVPQLRQALFPQSQVRYFDRHIEQLWHTHKIQSFPDRLQTQLPPASGAQ